MTKEQLVGLAQRVRLSPPAQKHFEEKKRKSTLKTLKFVPCVAGIVPPIVIPEVTFSDRFWRHRHLRERCRFITA